MDGRIKIKDLPLIKQRLIAQQGGICPLCGNDLTKAKPINVVVDHDHSNGYIRAALHRGCNQVEGKVKNLAITFGKTQNYKVFLTRLLAFWNKHSTPQTPWIHHTHRTAEETRASRNAAARKRYAAKKAGE